jgi:RNA-directed DNA polymerase
LEWHPEKTRIVYWKDDDRRGDYPNTPFDFLGYTLRPRRSKHRWGQYVVNFSPAVSNTAAQAMRQTMRSWRLRCRVDKRIDDFARMFNPVIRGWMMYYGRYDQSALYPTLRHFDRHLVCWAMAQYKRLRRHRRRAEHWRRWVVRRARVLFAHWPVLPQATAGR